MPVIAQGLSGEEHGYVSHSLRARVGSPLCAGLSAEPLCLGAACPGAERQVSLERAAPRGLSGVCTLSGHRSRWLR